MYEYSILLPIYNNNNNNNNDAYMYSYPVGHKRGSLWVVKVESGDAYVHMNRSRNSTEKMSVHSAHARVLTACTRLTCSGRTNIM